MAKFYLYEDQGEGHRNEVIATDLDFDVLKNLVSSRNQDRLVAEHYEVLTVRNDEIYLYATALIGCRWGHDRWVLQAGEITWAILDRPIDADLNKG